MIKGKQSDFEMGGSPDREKALEHIEFCLKHLWADNTKRTYEEAVYSLTWEEIIGALMEAKAQITELQLCIDDQLERDEANLDKWIATGICYTCNKPDAN